MFKEHFCETFDVLKQAASYIELVKDQDDSEISVKNFTTGEADYWEPLTKSSYAEFKFTIPIKVAKIIVDGNIDGVKVVLKETTNKANTIIVSLTTKLEE